MKLVLVVAVHNDEETLRHTLLASPSIEEFDDVVVQRGFRTVAAAYNDALRSIEADVFVFAHPDVFFPPGWASRLQATLLQLDDRDKEWGVAGLYGIASCGSRHGFLYSTGLGGFVGRPFREPASVQTVDEFVFAIRGGAGLFCDEQIPNNQFQLGATDLCLQAIDRGLVNYVIPGFAIHNSNSWTSLPTSFRSTYNYIKKKWRRLLPVTCPYMEISDSMVPMWKLALRNLLLAHRRPLRVTTRTDDPRSLYESMRTRMREVFK